MRGAVRSIRRIAPAGVLALSLGLLVPAFAVAQRAPAAADPSEHGYLLHDSHLHLTNDIQEGLDIHDFLKAMGSKVGRVAIFGL